MSKFLTPPVWYDSNGNLVEILEGTSGSNSVGIGKGANASDQDVAIGKGCQSGGGGVAIGFSASVSNNSVVVGRSSSSGYQGDIIVGNSSTTDDSGDNIILGNNSLTTGTDQNLAGNIIIGNNIRLENTYNTIQIGSSNVTYSAQIGDGKGLLRCRSLEVAPISYKISTYIDPVKNPVTISYPDKLILEKNGIYGFVFLVNGGRQTIPIVFNGTKSDAVKTYFNLSYGDTSDDYTIVYGSVVWGETDIKLRCSPFTAKDGTFIKIYLSYIVYFGSYQDS